MLDKGVGKNYFGGPPKFHHTKNNTESYLSKACLGDIAPREGRSDISKDLWTKFRGVMLLNRQKERVDLLCKGSEAFRNKQVGFWRCSTITLLIIIDVHSNISELCHILSAILIPNFVLLG